MAHVLPSWLSWYKKPTYVDLKAFASSLNKRAEEKYDERASSRNSFSSLRAEDSIPKDLTLERVLGNRTCSPMSLYDFYMYLKHIEYSQENLEFYIWFKDYQKRYTDDSIRSAQREKDAVVEVVSITPTSENVSLVDAEERAPAEKPFTRTESQIAPEFPSYIETLVLHEAARYPKPRYTTYTSSNDRHDTYSLDQDRHEELENMAALFLKPGSSKELNIPPSLRKSALTNLTTSTSPDHLIKIAEHIYHLLKYGSHRNFVRLGVNNGTFETLCMVTFVGITMTIAGLLAMLMLAFASPRIHKSPCWRGLATIPFWFVGISFLLAGMRGSCFLLLLFSRRQELPWERVGENDQDDHVESSTTTTASPQDNRRKRRRNLITVFARKLMIFERKIQVRDMGLRRLQRKIVVQSAIGAAVGTALLEVFFLCLPIWK